MWSGRLLLVALVAARAGGQQPTCISNLGNWCASGQCTLELRGTGICQKLGSFVDPRCMCPSDKCAGSDYKCYPKGSYTIVPGVYKIRNARWPNNVIGLAPGTPAPSQTINSGSFDDDEHKFTIVGPPAVGYMPLYLIYNKKYTGSVLAVLQTGPQRLDIASPSITGIAVLLTQIRVASLESDPANLGRTLLMIGTTEGYFLQMSVGATGATLGAVCGDPGLEGYWFFDPELPSDFKSTLYKFRVNETCRRPGTTSSGQRAARHLVAVLIAIVLPLGIKY